MGAVSFNIGEQEFEVLCRDGEEPRFMKLAAMLNAHWGDASRAAGNTGSLRAMLFVALMLADELEELRNQSAASAADDGRGEALARIADRLEALAEALEDAPASA